jgi:glycosyltransferase involved in cell wall biosynthesis
MRVLQFVPTFEPGAVGAHLRQVRRLLEDKGVATETYAEHIRPALAGQAVDFRRYEPQSGDVVLYHVAIGSGVADFVRDQAPTLVLDHHNITPAHFWAGWEPPVVAATAWARHQLAELAPRASAGIAHSAYSEAELTELHCHRTAVVPILLDTASFDHEAGAGAVEQLRRDGTVWLFVGRVAPNKAQHDLVKAFAVYRRVYDPSATLRIVGASSSDAYVEAIRRLVAALDLGGSVELTGAVSDAELAAHYGAADVFVCVSEHEGFCVPLLEAMHHGVPIVAYGATAVGETLAGGGIALPGKAPSLVAAAVARVHGDSSLRDQLVAAGHRRLADFSLDTTRAQYWAALEPVLA